MKVLAKKLLMLFASFEYFFLALERIYVFTSRARFSRLSRVNLLRTKDLLRPELEPTDIPLLRLGSQYDGGYIVFNFPDDFSTVVSLGVGDNIDFEVDCREKLKSRQILCFDGSISALPKEISGIEFQSIYVKKENGSDSITLRQILSGLAINKLVLKIDIEGDEWGVLETLSDEELSKFSQIVGEFHGLASSPSDQELSRKLGLLERLSEKFILVNSHANNWGAFRILKGLPIPDVIELTYINREHFKDRSLSHPKDNSLSSALNSACNPDRDEILFY